MTTTASTRTSTSNGTSTSTGSTGTAHACGQGAADAWKAGLDAAQAFWSTLATAWNIPGPSASAAPHIPTLPAAFEATAAAMNATVDSAARLTTELSTLAIDTLRHNARTLERAGDLLVSQFSGTPSKPAAEAARQIWDDSAAFASRAGERLTRAVAEHTQRLAHAAEQTLRRTTAPAAAN